MLPCSNSDNDGCSPGERLRKDRLVGISLEANILEPYQRRRSEPFALDATRNQRSAHDGPKRAASLIVEVFQIGNQAISPSIHLDDGNSDSKLPVPTYKPPSKHPPEREVIPPALIPEVLSMSGIETQEDPPNASILIRSTKSDNCIAHNSQFQSSLEQRSGSLDESDHRQQPLLEDQEIPTAKTPRGLKDAVISNYGSSHVEQISSILMKKDSISNHDFQTQASNSRLGSQTYTNQMTAASFDKVWRQVQRQRVNNWTLRDAIHRIRIRLRDLQLAKSKADDSLFQHMTKRELLGQNIEEKRLLYGERSTRALMQACQLIRDQYGPLEDDCNRLEDKLSADEFKQNQLEEELYKHLKEPPSPNSESGTMTQIDSTATASTPSPMIHDLVEASELHPLVRAFLSKLGDLYLLMEECDNLVDDKETLVEERSKRSQVGLQLSVEDQNFLINFESTESELTKEITETQNEVNKMRKDCIERGLVDENDEPTDLVTQERLSFREENLNAQENTSEYVKYPLLLPRPGIRDAVGKDEVEKAFHVKPHDTTNCINRWLLENMLGSPLEGGRSVKDGSIWFLIVGLEMFQICGGPMFTLRVSLRVLVPGLTDLPYTIFDLGLAFGLRYRRARDDSISSGLKVAQHLLILFLGPLKSFLRISSHIHDLCPHQTSRGVEYFMTEDRCDWVGYLGQLVSILSQS
ncbi:hypothetical protein HYALB_00008859 [Hymenoscyphus albidus]|uniref:Uncharacterized protein n=1 Tax=Hymenoscyphus albidus TaxID=595503 RepID=A0A9N9PVX8_9HELO|nr:hypothetical protein HYALB_00008859 [Hymenoscyphus albidus]